MASWLIENYTEKNAWYTFTKGFSDSDTEKSRPHKLIDELLVSFYNENLSTSYSQLTSRGLDYNSFAIKNIDGIFGDNDDFRKKLLSVVDVDTKVSLKYQERSGTTSIISMENKLLPVMRLSELYFIKIEYLARNGKTAEAVDLLNKFRVERGCFGNKIDADADMNTVLAALDSEVWRDYVAEGQYFFYCKKNNAATINNNGVYVDMNGKYTMVIPDSEISLN
jgi:SusD family.